MRAPRHDQDHEDRVLSFVLGDEEGPELKSLLLDQLSTCPDCVGYGYGLIEGLPSILRALDLSPEDIGRVEPAALARLELLLEQNAGRLATIDAPTRQEECPSLLDRTVARWKWTAAGTAAAAGLALWLLFIHPDRPAGPVARVDPKVKPLPASSATSLAAEATEGFPSAGFGFGGDRGLLPFQRGYAYGLLLDANAAGLLGKAGQSESWGHVPEELQRLWDRASRLPGDATQPGVPGDPLAAGCTLEAWAPDLQAACGWGLFAYRLRRDIELSGGSDPLLRDRLRSRDSRELLEWASSRPELGSIAVPVPEELHALAVLTRSQEIPDEDEVALWEKVILEMYRNPRWPLR